MFVGRERELKDLRELISSRGSNIAVVYGRRRIGKSELIRTSLEGEKALFFEGLEGKTKGQQMDSFLLQLSLQLGSERKKFKTWTEAFHHLFTLLKDNPHHLVFDEFQWLANYKKGVVSELKLIWDQYLSRIEGLTLVLCGSIASFMIKQVIKSNALYGRTSLSIHLKGLSLKEANQILGDKGENELALAYMVAGGVPKYLEVLAQASSIEIALQKNAFRENGYFVEEFERIFTSHFGKSDDYRNILTVLSQHSNGLFHKEMADACEISTGGRFSDLLFNLESAGFIFKYTPVNVSVNSKLIKYTLSDPYLRFYFSMIKPNLPEIKSNQNIFSQLTQAGVYFDWRGKAFECMCIEHAYAIAKILEFSGVSYRVGPYFESSRQHGVGVQVDLLFDRADNVMTLCEMKYTQGTVGVSVIDEVERKVEILRRKFPKKTIQKVLVSHHAPSQHLQESGYFYRYISSSELMTL